MINNSFDSLKECVKAVKKHRSENGIVETAVAIEMMLGDLSPKMRKQLWNYLANSRRAMGNKIFEDSQDLAEFLLSRNLGGGILR